MRWQDSKRLSLRRLQKQARGSKKRARIYILLLHYPLWCDRINIKESRTSLRGRQGNVRRFPWNHYLFWLYLGRGQVYSRGESSDGLAAQTRFFPRRLALISALSAARNRMEVVLPSSGKVATPRLMVYPGIYA